MQLETYISDLLYRYECVTIPEFGAFLTQRVSATKIPFEVASKKIAKRVKLLKSYLTQGETLTFKNIGEIAFNNEGKILFEPTYHLNYLTDSFGVVFKICCSGFNCSNTWWFCGF